MRLIKRITGLLEVEPEEGKIWLNSISGCILRINNLNFENNEEKFSSMDIKDGNVIFNKEIINSDTEFEIFLNDFIDTIILEKENITPDNMLKLYKETKRNLILNIKSLKENNNGDNQ